MRLNQPNISESGGGCPGLVVIAPTCSGGSRASQVDCQLVPVALPLTAVMDMILENISLC
jgi:hypothetical protein